MVGDVPSGESNPGPSHEAPPWRVGKQPPDIGLVIALHEEFEGIAEEWHAERDSIYAGYDRLLAL
jgi:hypothetical protein